MGFAFSGVKRSYLGENDNLNEFFYSLDVMIKEFFIIKWTKMMRWHFPFGKLMLIKSQWNCRANCLINFRPLFEQSRVQFSCFQSNLALSPLIKLVSVCEETGFVSDRYWSFPSKVTGEKVEEFLVELNLRSSVNERSVRPCQVSN